VTLVYIRWRDACHDMGECAIKDLGELAELHEVGWLLAENTESVTIGVEQMDGATSARMWLTIPRVNIVEERRTTLSKAFPPRTIQGK
jgi:hypothetical protein